MSDEEALDFKGYYNSLSTTACFISMFFNKTKLATGTCFFVQSKHGPVLITNRHNFTGKNNFTGKVLSKTGGIPNHAVVTLQTNGGEVYYHIDLFDHEFQEKPAWIEHPTLGEKADIVALPVYEMSNIINEENSISLDANWHNFNVGSELQVIGYPFGQISGPFAVWSKGYIATEPDFDIGGLPVFLIDCKARPGQSGSPVFARFKVGDVVEHQGNHFQAKRTMNYFAGIYSGRLRSDSDLGMVWKQQALVELVKNANEIGSSHVMKKSRHLFKTTGSKPVDLANLISDNNSLL
ncbi:MAG: serine protease [Rhizobiaceae bacterium]|nr:serine protease [Rhizobiaceae bacterium]